MLKYFITPFTPHSLTAKKLGINYITINKYTPIYTNITINKINILYADYIVKMQIW